MKKYALILACLAWALSANVKAQTGGGSGGAGGGAAGGTTGGAAATAGAAGSAIGGSAAGTLRGRTPVQPPVGTVPPTTVPPVTLPPGAVAPVIPPGGTTPGVGTPGTGVGVGTGTGADSGAIGGVTPGTGATGGTGIGTAATGDIIPNVTGTTADIQTGVNGIRPGGVTATPGVVGTMAPADMALAQQIRTQLIMGRNNGVNGASTAAGVIPPQGLAGVQISSLNGVVTLRGRVNTEAERRLLENQIRGMTGVRTVVNGLTVAGPNSRAGATGTTTTPGGTVIPGATP